MDLKNKIKNLPPSPGVYLMKDSLGNIIYVGKSKNLKNRVGSYFQNSKSHSPKVIKLVKNLKDFEYRLTDTEFDAFIMERKMNSAVDKFDFETAAKHRDYITSINYILDKLNVIEFSNKNKNIVMLEGLDNNIAKLFLIKGNKITFSEKYNLKEDLDEA